MPPRRAESIRSDQIYENDDVGPGSATNRGGSAVNHEHHHEQGEVRGRVCVCMPGSSMSSVEWRGAAPLPPRETAFPRSLLLVLFLSPPVKFAETSRLFNIIQHHPSRFDGNMQPTAVTVIETDSSRSVSTYMLHHVLACVLVHFALLSYLAQLFRLLHIVQLRSTAVVVARPLCQKSTTAVSEVYVLLYVAHHLDFMRIIGLCTPSSRYVQSLPHSSRLRQERVSTAAASTTYSKLLVHCCTAAVQTLIKFI